MRIYKILNNNVVIILDEHGQEQIVMGRGIAFKKKNGAELDPNQIDKVFTVNVPDINSKFQELVADIPIIYWEIVEEIVTYTKSHIGKKINDCIYISLTDHIYMSICRHGQGVEVKNVLLWDIKRFYKDEFLIGTKALDIIEEKTGVHLQEDEAGFIALHLVNAQMQEYPEKVQNIYEITKIMQEITNIVKYYFHMEFDEDSVYYYRFITHLSFFAQRLIQHNAFACENDEELLGIIKIKYKNAYECAKKINQFIIERYNYLMSDEETIYLTIHIARIIYKNNR